MNDKSYKGQYWDSLNRMKNWCINSGLPEKFYKGLQKRKLLLDMEWIRTNELVHDKSYEEIESVIKDIFECIDFFK